MKPKNAIVEVLMSRDGLSRAAANEALMERSIDMANKTPALTPSACEKSSSERLAKLRRALAPFAEEPTDWMDDYPCHKGIVPKEACWRCSRAIAAWNALKESDDDKGVDVL